MIIINQNTETILLKDLGKLHEQKPEAYCFYIAFSKLKRRKEDWYDILFEKTRTIPNAHNLKIYLCDDNDIFMILNEMTVKTFQDFIQDLKKALKLEKLNDYTGSFQIQDHWEKLKLVCKKKIKIYEDRQRGVIVDVKSAAVELDAKSVTSLPSRREKNREKSILIADDDSLSRTLIKNVLDRDYKLSFAEDGKSAISEYVAKAPDVLFLDIGLPDMSGHDVLHNIFQIDQNAYVVMFSGRKDEKNVMKAIDIGAKGYITKPFTRQKLIDYIEKSPFIRDKHNVA